MGGPEEATHAVEEAIKAGYRQFDTAIIYGSEPYVGEGIRRSGVPRSEVFVTTKLWNTHHRAEDVPKALGESLKSLGMEYVDLYLMHWPLSVVSENERSSKGGLIDAKIDYIDTYRAMEKLLDTGKVKAIGVSNFTISHLKRLMTNTGIVPAINQIELHPYLPQPELVEFCKSKGIVPTAYSPLGSTDKLRILEDPVVNAIAKEHGATAAQVLIAWGVGRGYAVIPRSLHTERIINNFTPIELSNDDVGRISAIQQRGRVADPVADWGEQFQWVFNGVEPSK
ncbi:Aldo/keto reductase [Linderina pennispora]|uniref:Aldo/keto reductase n=1 Tax=Linderina pennispora TaxID=61395 RepID=A0A1Y1W953_9FUNG|nr:Aldo/keto reductase [Linderina pennispora]ORX70059.1 Aldo/keto reductase [Linderina pennispora]